MTYLLDGRFYTKKPSSEKTFFCRKCNEYHYKKYKSPTIYNDTLQCCDYWKGFLYKCDKCKHLYTRRKLNRTYKCKFCENFLKYREPFVVHNYSYNPTAMKYYNDNDTSYDGRNFSGIGVELEVDQSGERDDMSEMTVKLLNEEVYCKHDGSLDKGFEIITYPHTYESFKKMNWEHTMRELVLNGYRSHDSGNCGLHVHVSRDKFTRDTLAKIIYFYEKWWDDILMFSRRSADRADRWASKYMSTASLEYCYTVVDKYNDKNNHSWRYHAVNLQKHATVEFRLMRGTLNYKTFMSSIEFVLKIVENASRVTDIDNLSQWLDGLSDDCIAYMKKRGCFGYKDDGTEDYEENYGGDDLCA